MYSSVVVYYCHQIQDICTIKNSFKISLRTGDQINKLLLCNSNKNFHDFVRITNYVFHRVIRKHFTQPRITLNPILPP